MHTSIIITPAVSIIIGVFILAAVGLSIYHDKLKKRLEKYYEDDRRILSELVKVLRDNSEMYRENLSAADKAFLLSQAEDAARWRVLRYYGPEHPIWEEWAKAKDEYVRDSLVDFYRND